MRSMAYALTVLAPAALLAGAAGAASVTLPSVRDNTLIQVPEKFPYQSNGAGEHFFAGATFFNGLRRGLIKFDYSSIPAGSTITSVTLTLHMTFTITGPQPIALHRVLADWGEGASDAKGEEGGGAPAQPGDVTWLHTFFDASVWAAEGGDFSPTSSAEIAVGAADVYSWSGAGMVADVQAWLDNPASNFGWMLRGNEAELITAKRFDSRERTIVENRPSLVVTYLPPCPADLNHSGGVNGLDLAALLAAWTGAGSYASCPPYIGADLNHDCKVNGLDLAGLLAAWGPCPR